MAYGGIIYTSLLIQLEFPGQSFSLTVCCIESDVNLQIGKEFGGCGPWVYSLVMLFILITKCVCR